MTKSLTEPELNQYNTNALCDDLRRKQAESGRQIISSPLKQPRQLQSDPRRAWSNVVGTHRSLNFFREGASSRVFWYCSGADISL